MKTRRPKTYRVQIETEVTAPIICDDGEWYEYTEEDVVNDLREAIDEGMHVYKMGELRIKSARIKGKAE